MTRGAFVLVAVLAGIALSSGAEAQEPTPGSRPVPSDVKEDGQVGSPSPAPGEPPSEVAPPDATRGPDTPATAIADTAPEATAPAGAPPEPPVIATAPAEPQKPPQSLNEALLGLDQTGTPPPPAREGEPRATGEDEPLPAGEKRSPVDYDGRAAPSTDAGDVVRWIPRIVLYPAYLVMEYGIRVPTVWTITRIEESHLTDRVSDFFTWDNGNASLFPLVSFDFGIRPNAGLVFRWNEVIPRHEVSGTFFVGPDDLWAGGARVDQKLFRDEGAVIRWSGGYIRRPDNVFYGVSDLSSRCNQLARGCRFRSAIAEASVALVGWEKMLNQVTFATTFRHARFSTDNTDAPPLTDEEAAALPGFTNGYQVIEPKVNFAIDSRDEDLNFSRGTGLRFEGQSAFAIDVVNPDSRWWRAGGEAAAFYDLGFGQVLATSLYYEGVLNVSRLEGSTTTRAPIPFFELAYMGGQDQMKGFLRRRLLGNNAWAANFEYRYPITWGLDASFFSSIGNTFDDLGEWHIAKNYLNYGLSLKLAQDRVSSFETILGWGSNRLDEPLFDPFDQFRFALGINKGF